MRNFESGGSWARPKEVESSSEIETRLRLLHSDVESALTAIHDEFLRNMDRLARSTGQRTRADRL